MKVLVDGVLYDSVEDVSSVPRTTLLKHLDTSRSTWVDRSGVQHYAQLVPDESEIVPKIVLPKYTDRKDYTSNPLYK